VLQLSVYGSYKLPEVSTENMKIMDRPFPHTTWPGSATALPWNA